MFENRMARKIYGSKRGKYHETGEDYIIFAVHHILG
jgi:hypothetical protein